MPKNPFTSPEGAAKVPRNNVDLSHRKLFTSDFGRLVPFYCQEVLPGDSFEIDAQVGLRSMPTVFPVQTRMRMSVEFYYCRNRCVYKDWEDFIFKTKDNLVHPWIRINTPEHAKDMLSTGSLTDLWRCATTIGSNGEVVKLISLSYRYFYIYNYDMPEQTIITNLTHNILNDFDGSYSQGPNILNSSVLFGLSFSDVIDRPLKSGSTIVFKSNLNNTTYLTAGLCLLRKDSTSDVLRPFKVLSNSISIVDGLLTFTVDEQLQADTSGLGEYRLGFYGCYHASGLYSDASVPIASSSRPSIDYYNFDLTLFDSFVHDASESDFLSQNVFFGNNPKRFLNALPFRHYEMICNYYYRNDKNNPYILNGQVEYNKFIPTYDGGADDNTYTYHYRDFELDMFTSAQQSPQFGDAPLVGLTYNPDGETAELTFQDSESNNYTVTVGLEGDGRLSSIADFSKEIPSATLRRLQNQIQYGISINDLRMGNSFQRFLENTMRRGLRYRNQLRSHFGVSVDYPDIDIPQYIGGYSDYLGVDQINSTAETSSMGLGDYVGRIEGGISLKHKIHCYCPEHGFIIGIVSFYPIPMYAQVNDPVMMKHDAFDYLQTEFNKIGYGPIDYSVVSPMQGGNVNDTFGYQKAWYDYMRSFDSVHGDFRTTLRDFTLMRTFAERPVLSESFTKVFPEQFNNIFATNNMTDAYGSSAKFLLSSSVQVTAKRPVSIFGQPSLE